MGCGINYFRWNNLEVRLKEGINHARSRYLKEIILDIYELYLYISEWINLKSQNTRPISTSNWLMLKPMRILANPIRC